MSVQTMAMVWAGSQHSGSELLMLLAIADFADDDGKAYPAIATLARKCRMTPRNVNHILPRLTGSGELVIKAGHGPHGTNLYRVNLAQLEGVKAASGVKSSSGVKPSSCTPEGGFPNPLKPASPKPSLNHQETPDTSSAQKPPRLACPHDQIKALYAEVLPELPAIKVWNSKRQMALKARWAETSKAKGWTSAEDGLAWFRRFFEAVASSDFLMGRLERRAGHEGWRCDFDFLMTPAKFVGVIEGKYANRGAA